MTYVYIDVNYDAYAETNELQLNFEHSKLQLAVQDVA